MNIHGFFIRQIRLEGKNVKAAYVCFDKGLNVVTGPSDTGKSYIWNCINYMLGAEERLKEIDQINGYTKIFLELSTFDDQQYTLQRSIDGGATNLYRCCFNEIDGFEPVPLKTKHGTEGKSVSEFLLSLCNIEGVKVLSSKKSGTTNALTIRTLLPFIMVNESDIMAEQSPITEGRTFSPTAKKMNFNYLLTGKDAGDIVAPPKPEIQKATKAGKLHAYESMIQFLEQSLDSTENPESNYDRNCIRLNNLNDRIAIVTEDINNNKSQLSDIESNLAVVWSKNKEVNSRIIVLDELLSRFNLLKEHYISDMNRLDFVSEGEHYFQQLEGVNCPVCGNAIEEIESCFCDTSSSRRVILQAACEKEIYKINTQMGDLKETILRLENERKEKLKIAEDFDSRIQQYQCQIKELLESRLNPCNKELRTLIEEKDRVAEYSLKVKQITELIQAKDEVEATAVEKLDDDIVSTALDRKALRELCDIIELLLRGFNYEDVGVVEFIEEYDGPKSMNMDFLIKGQHRQSHGKGVRAILHAAFNIALMKYCGSKVFLHHPGLIILDSPLTTFKPGKGDSSDERVREDIRKQFFKYLCDNLDKQQVIILDNEEPDEETKKKINCIEFTKTTSEGRYGFFPK